MSGLRLAVSGLSAVLLGAVSVTGAHAAQFFVSTNAASGALHTSGPTNSDSIRSGSPVSTSSSSETDRSATEASKSRSSSTATAEVGAVHAVSTARADSFAPGCCTAARSGSSAYAEYNDTLILTSSQYANGTTGTITVNLMIDGDTGELYDGAFWDGSVYWRSTTVVNGQSSVDFFSRQGNGTNGFITSGSPFGLRTLTFDVVFGQAANVILRVETIAAAGAGGFGPNFAEFTSDLGHTVSWNGISKLVVGGQEVTDFAAYSPDTAFDFVRGYVAPTAGVPEPTIWALMILGFGSAGAALRRRRGTASAF